MLASMQTHPDVNAKANVERQYYCECHAKANANTNAVYPSMPYNTIMHAQNRGWVSNLDNRS